MKGVLLGFVGSLVLLFSAGCKKDEPGLPSTILITFMKDGAPLANKSITRVEHTVWESRAAGSTNAEGQLSVPRSGSYSYYFLDSTHFVYRSFSQEELDQSTAVHAIAYPEQQYSFRLVDTLPGRRHSAVYWVEHPVAVPALFQNPRLQISYPDSLISPIDTTFYVASFPTSVLLQSVVYDSAGTQVDVCSQWVDVTPQDTGFQCGPF